MTGVVLPIFRPDAADALAVAEAADEAGVDGVFCYDHLWPMGRPDRPALAPFPVLATVARRHGRLKVGTLVARIGLVPDQVLVGEFTALDRMAPGRVIAGLGTGDHLSAAENEAFGVPPGSAEARRVALGRCALALRDRGFPVWIGGGSRRTRLVAEEAGVAVNLWDVPAAAVADQARRTEVTWGGPVPLPARVRAGGAGRQAGVAGRADGAGGGSRGADGADRAGVDADVGDEGRAALGDVLRELAAAGATWAVFAWPAPLGALVACAGEATLGR
jgi:alkanesulfonate monooxygenase SsuD/methylene tetrahydromethanopterin reductase-like flavin-dependent oxidoreductase (luciferase family)